MPQTLVVVDVESDGPVPHLYSMVCFGAIIVEDSLDRTFYGRTAPISDRWEPDALKISGFSRLEHEHFPPPLLAMNLFENWLQDEVKGRPVFVSDNPAYDFQWINYYFHRYVGRNPFGWSGRRIGDMYAGLVKDTRKPWKHLLRKTPHTHDPVDDAKGNAEALLAMRDMGLKGIT